MSDDRVVKGHLARWWDEGFKHLPYVKQPVTDAEIGLWQGQGYDYVKSFTGSMYDNRNPMPDWVRTVEEVFGLYKQTYTFYKMKTLEIMPTHSDHYRTYCRIHEVEPTDVYRVVLMLEDWKPGHYLEIDGVGYVNWKAGDWFRWKGDVPHAASNIGIEDRYTLQVTGISIFTGQLNDLVSYRIPNYNSSKYLSHPFLKFNIFPKINSKHDKHIFIYFNNSKIKTLDTITHDADTISTLNKAGIEFYLFEPLCSYSLPDKVHNQYFYSDFGHVEPGTIGADELDSIYDYAVRNNLTNIRVRSCDYNIDKYYPQYSDRLTLMCDDLFLKSQVQIKNLKDNPGINFTKKFICLNWRYTKHRNLVSAFLAGRDGYLSWYFRSSFDVLKQNLTFDLENWKTKYPKHYETLLAGNNYIEEHSPLCVDETTDNCVVITDASKVNIWPIVKEYEQGTTPALHNGVRNSLEDYYSDIFLDVINETRYFQPTGNFSEKIFQAVQYMKPFVLVAPPKTLEYFKSLGFQTFSEFWDESYDDELDHEVRLSKIFSTIDFITDKSIEELRLMYVKMMPIFKHNLALYKEKFANPEYWNRTNG